MPDAIRIHLAGATRVVVLREHHASIVRDHDGSRAGLIGAIDALLAEVGVDYDAVAPVSRGQEVVGRAVSESGRVVRMRRR